MANPNMMMPMPGPLSMDPYAGAAMQDPQSAYAAAIEQMLAAQGLAAPGTAIARDPRLDELGQASLAQKALGGIDMAQLMQMLAPYMQGGLGQSGFGQNQQPMMPMRPQAPGSIQDLAEQRRRLMEQTEGY